MFVTCQGFFGKNLWMGAFGTLGYRPTPARWVVEGYTAF
nr:MAG TPA: hypothetical protein [Caudoviricetes sp.]